MDTTTNNKLRGEGSTLNLAIAVFTGVTKRLTYKELLARIVEVCPESGKGKFRHVHLIKTGLIAKDENDLYGPTFNPTLDPKKVITDELIEKSSEAQRKARLGTDSVNANNSSHKKVAKGINASEAESAKKPRPEIKRTYIKGYLHDALKEGKVTAILSGVVFHSGVRVLVNDETIVRIESCGKICFLDSQTGPEIVAAANGKFFGPDQVAPITTALGFETPDAFYDSFHADEIESPCWPYVGFLCKVSVE